MHRKCRLMTLQRIALIKDFHLRKRLYDSDKHADMHMPPTKFDQLL